MTDGSPKCNILGYEACRIAYRKCDERLSQAVNLIDTNRQLIEEFIAVKMPEIQVVRLEGTYLLWMDFRALGVECHELARILKEDGNLFFDDGYIFGEEGIGFERWNIACPTKYIIDGLEC